MGDLLKHLRALSGTRKADRERVLQASRRDATVNPEEISAFLAEREPLEESIRRDAAANPEETRAFLEGLDFSIREQADEYSDFMCAIRFDSDRWSSMLLDEFDRLYWLCNARPSWNRLFAFGSFAYVAHFAKASLKLALTQKYIAALDSPHAAVRHRVILDHIGVDMGAGTTAFDEAVRWRLADPDWKVRAVAENYLCDKNALPAAYRASMVDRVRRHFFTWIIYYPVQPGT